MPPRRPLYGPATEIALAASPVFERRFPRRFIQALGIVKGTAATVNAELGGLPGPLAQAVEAAAQEVAEGRWDDQFAVGVYTTGGGEAVAGNADEVIATRAGEILRGARQGRRVKPADVALNQPPAEAVLAAAHLAASLGMREDLQPSLYGLRSSLAFQSRRLTGLGEEMSGYAAQIEETSLRIEQGIAELREVALSGDEFAGRLCRRLEAATGVQLRAAAYGFQPRPTIDPLVSVHGRLRTAAVSLWKIGDDLRLLASGPRDGIRELHLPEVQPGSSIMPGKVNPVVIESLIMACARVVGNDVTLAICGAAGGRLEQNRMLPLAVVTTLDSIGLLAASAANFVRRCVDGLELGEPSVLAGELGEPLDDEGRIDVPGAGRSLVDA